MSTPAQTFRARCLLTRDLSEVVARLGGLPPLDPDARRGDDADRRQAREEHDLGVVERTRLHRRRTLLLAALQRLEDGSYGLCLDCQAPIAPARLKVFAEAERCVRCHADLERRVQLEGLAGGGSRFVEDEA